jgi:hypothetical protein
MGRAGGRAAAATARPAGPGAAGRRPAGASPPAGAAPFYTGPFQVCTAKSRSDAGSRERNGFSPHEARRSHFRYNTAWPVAPYPTGGISFQLWSPPYCTTPYIFLLARPLTAFGARPLTAFSARRSRAFSKNSQVMELFSVLNSDAVPGSHEFHIAYPRASTGATSHCLLLS